MAKIVTNMLLLKSRLYELRLEEGKPLKPHLDKYYSIVMDLQNIEVKLDDEDLAIYLLCSLSPSYKNFRESLHYGRENLSSDDVKNSLTQRYLIDTQLSQKSQGGSSDGLFVRWKSFVKGSTSRAEKKVKRGRSHGGLAKIRLATTASLKATSRRIVGNGKKNYSNDGAMDATSNVDLAT